MALNPISSTPTPATSQAGTHRSALEAGASAGTDDAQDRFMNLLVAQIRNQDPLNPMDNAQMTSQIAQINTVAGIERLNKTAQSILTQLASLQAQLALPPAAPASAAADLPSHTDSPAP